MIDEMIIKKLSLVTDEEREILSGRRDIDKSLYMYKPENIINSRKLLSERKLITVRPHTRFVRFPEHKHDYVEVVYMCRGKTTHIINGERVELKEGNILFLNQNSTQEILPAGENDIAVNFIILPEFFDTTLSMLGNEETPLRRFIVNCLKSEDIPSSYLYFDVADILPIQNLIENLIWTLMNDVKNKRNINQMTMGLLFLQLLNCTDRLKSQNDETDIAIRTLRYVEEHYSQGSLTELSELLHYDFSWLSREIKRQTGKTYTELVQEKRLSQAAFLLKNTDLSVCDISLKVGYENISYFHRIFLKKYDVSPKHYRKIL